MYRNKDKVLEYCDKEAGWVAISSELSVVARVRAQDKKSGYGACIEFVNMDLVPVRLVVPANRILGSASNTLREELFDRGFWLEDEKYNWSRVLRYLRQQIKRAPTGISAFNTGWHGDVFVTTETTFGAFEEPYFYAGEIVDSNFAVKGSLDHWQQEIGCLLSGNPTLIFSVGVALAAPLLAPSGGESSVFHLMGSSSQGKSGAIFVGSSVYGSHSYKKTWYSTNNGIESVSVNYNDVMLPLDEIGMARSENLDTAAYQIVNGDGKLRSLITGALGKQAKWRTLVLSTGEVGLIDLLEEIGKKPAAGQLVRIVEIPLTEKYGCFSSIHRFNDSHEFAKHLEEATKKYHGSLFPAWMCLIVKQPDLELLLRSETDRLMQRWKESCMSAQVLRVLHRFCLVAVALSLASRHKLVPWSEEESLFSVHSIFQRWIAARGHTQNHEEFEVLLALKQALAKWEKQLSEISSGRVSSTGYYRQDGDEVQWLIHKNVFIRDLQLRKQYISQLTPLVQRRWFESNEGARGTLRVKVNGKLERFFAFTPAQIIQETRGADRRCVIRFPVFPHFPHFPEQWHGGGIMTSNEQVLLQSILAKIDHVERVVLEQRLQQQKVELLGKDILTIDECAALLGLSTNQLYKLTSSAEIPFFKIGKHLRFERQAIMDWVEQQRVSSHFEIEKRAANYVATTSRK